MIILSTVPLRPSQVEQIQAVAPGAQVLVHPGSTTEPDQLDRAFAQAEVVFLYGQELTAERLRRASRLRWVQSAYAGVDRLLAAVPQLRHHPAILTNARGMHAATIAEHVFMLMLAWARRLPEYLQNQRRRRWERLPVRELAGETLAVVGLGAVGQEVARRAQLFGMRVLGVRRQPQPVAGVERVVSPVQLHQILSAASWVVISVPLTRETRGMIGHRELAAMGPETFLINVARGEVVDEAALTEALRQGRIAGAALDVFAAEPLPPDHPLWELENVWITPHVAGNRRDYVAAALELFLDNLQRYVRGEPLRNQVDKDLGY